MSFLDKTAFPAAESFRHIPSIDGLRAISVFMVFSVHTYLTYFPGGFIGVDIFFEISGFLITSLLLREFGRNGRISLSAFYARRALRILPALVVCIAFVFLVAPQTISNRGESAAFNLAAALFSFMNWNRALGATGGALGHTWSLSIEEQFYLVWSLLVFACAVWKKPTFILWLAIGGVITITLWRLTLAVEGATLKRLYNGLDTHSDGLLAGCMLAALPVTQTLKTMARYWIIPTALAIVIWFTFDVDSKLLPFGGYSLVVITTTWLLIAAIHANGIPKRVLESPPAIWLGKRSYSFYLWHLPIISILGESGMRRTEWIIPAFVLSLLASELSYRFVELPFLRIKHRVHSREPQAPIEASKSAL